MKSNCPFSKKCELYNNKLYLHHSDAEKYHQNYCHSPMSNFSNCKRFKLYIEMDNCPNYLLPDSSYKLDIVIARMNSSQKETNSF